MKITHEQAAAYLLDSKQIIVKHENLGEYKYKFVEIPGEPSFLAIFWKNNYKQHIIGRVDIPKLCKIADNDPEVTFWTEDSNNKPEPYVAKLKYIPTGSITYGVMIDIGICASSKELDKALKYIQETDYELMYSYCMSNSGSTYINKDFEVTPMFN